MRTQAHVGDSTGKFVHGFPAAEESDLCTEERGVSCRVDSIRGKMEKANATGTGDGDVIAERT
ncbi:MAG: hypothetical protein ABI623_07430, partial [bacterium]